MYMAKGNFCFWDEMIEPLRQIGRRDLLEALKFSIDAYRGEVGWRGSIKAFDRQYLQGRLVQLKRTLTARKSSAARNGIAPHLAT